MTIRGNRFSLIAIVCSLSVLLASQVSAAALGSIEPYQGWNDVTNQTAIGNWTKADSPNPVAPFTGELVAAPAHGSTTPRTGDMLLDLRTEDAYDFGGDGADYSYHMNTDDFGGVDPISLSSGSVELEFWTCPDTWSNDLGGFIGAGIYQTTSLRNGDGDILAAIGMNALGTQNSPEVMYSIDGINWISTGLEANSGDWSKVTMSVDLDSMTSIISFEDTSSNSFTSGTLNWSSGITDTSVQTLNFEMDHGVNKNYFDDFAFSVTASAVPEPSSLILGLFGMCAVTVRRRT